MTDTKSEANRASESASCVRKSGERGERLGGSFAAKAPNRTPSMSFGAQDQHGRSKSNPNSGAARARGFLPVSAFHQRKRGFAFVARVGAGRRRCRAADPELQAEFARSVGSARESAENRARPRSARRYSSAARGQARGGGEDCP